MGQRVAFFALLVASSAAFATPQIQVIASTVSGHPTQIVAGEPTLRWFANTSTFGRVQGSYNGEWFAFAGLINNPGDNWQAWSFGRVDDVATWRTPFIEDRAWPTDNTRTIDDNRTTFGVANDGRMLFVANASGPTGADDFVLSYNGTSFTEIAVEGSLPSFGGPFALIQVVSGSAINPNTGDNWFLSGTNSPSNNGAVWAGQSSTPLIRGVTQVLWNSSPFTIDLIENDRMRVGADPETFLLQGRIGAAGAVIVGHDVMARVNFPLPGSASSVNVLSLDTGLGTSTISSNGLYHTYRGIRTDNTDFAVFGRANKYGGGRTIVEEGDLVVPSGTEVYDDSASNVFSGQAFQVAAVNSFGDRLLGAYTDAPLGQNYVLVLNGAKVILRGGDPIDLDGNGLFDDNTFFNQIVSDNIVFSDNNRVLAGATVRNGAGTVTGLSILSFDAPIPGDVNGDGEVGAADFSELAAAYDAASGDPNFDTDADLNGDGEVGAADFSILAANYDRTR